MLEIAADLERDICSRLNALSDKINGKIGRNYGEHFNNSVFEMNDYYWGDCTCGYAEIESEWISSNFHKDFCYQIDYEKLTKEYPDQIFLPEKEMRDLCEKHNIPYNGGISSAVHCSCDYDEKWNNFLSVYSHKENCLLIRPNFKHFDFEISWYKYIGRGMEYNREIDKKEIKAIFDDCEESLINVRC